VVNRLAKLAARSAQLRKLAAIKQAGILGAAVKTMAGAALKHPVQAGLGALTVAGGVAGAVGTTKKYKSEFSPAGLAAQRGEPPVPPGA
jgi:hypothetical protein